MKKLIIALSGLCLASQALGADPAATRATIEANLQSNVRDAAEVARDTNRKPAEVLEFFGLEDDMKVLEISPASGYWSKFVGPTLCENGGELVVSVGVSDSYASDVMSLDGMDCVTAINSDITLRNLPAFNFDTNNFDMVLTFWNLHNPSAEGRENLNSAVFDALKPGGIYGVVDHTRRHMQPNSRAIGRRLDPMLVVKEMLNVGFELVDYSDMHYHGEDDLTQEVGSPGVRGNTDRFTLSFRKPM
ncbi:MAG TPA: methyltransferase [Gammaproteobacteria bacterium]|nr:methyltransferase [Gammaproteobacteria bacterium]